MINFIFEPQYQIFKSESLISQGREKMNRYDKWLRYYCFLSDTFHFLAKNDRRLQLQVCKKIQRFQINWNKNDNLFSSKKLKF